MIMFFADGHIPYESADFLEAFSVSSDRQRLELSAQIRDFTPNQIDDYSFSILADTSDQDLLAMTFLAPDVIEKMNIESLQQHFKIVYKLKRLQKIDPKFFDQCAASLVRHCNPLLKVNFLGVIHTVIANFGLFKNLPLETVQGNQLDQAVAANVEEMLKETLTHNDSLYCINGLMCFELPTALGVLLRYEIERGEAEVSVNMVNHLFKEDKLSERYIEVCRRVLGDEQFLSICDGQMQKALQGGPANHNRICSVAKLASIFGEAVFHSPQFLENLFNQDGDGHVPRYISSLNAHGLYAFDFPLIRAFMVENLERLIFFKPSNTNELGLTRDLLALSHKEGVGAEALKLLLQRMGDLTGGEASDDPAAVLIESLYDAPTPSERSRGNALLHHVVEIVGLNTLHAVVPDVGTNFLSEFIETKKPSMGAVEIMRLFPQMKGRVLEDQLGL